MQKRITTRVIESLKQGDLVWDKDVRGFGVRLQRRDPTYILKTRVKGKPRWFSIGVHGAPWTPETARTEAKRVLGDIASGVDLAAVRAAEKAAPMMAAFCDRYIKDAERGLVTYRGKPKKASTLAVDKGRIERHIKPLLGEHKVKDISRADVEGFMRDVASGKTAADVKTGKRGRAIVKGGKTAAIRAVGLLGSIFSHAVKLGIRPDNPVRGVERLQDTARDRVLTPDEWKRLGKALDAYKAEGGNSHAINIVRLIALTGCRRAEIAGLTHSEIDVANCVLTLGDTKTGSSVRPLGKPARDALRNLTEEPEHDKWLFPAETEEASYQGLTKAWARIRQLAKLPDVTPHTLRHSFATAAGELCYSTSTIAALLGHRAANVTERYVHRRVDRAVIAAADTVSGHIEKLLAGKAEEAQPKGAEVVPFPGAEEAAASA